MSYLSQVDAPQTMQKGQRIAIAGQEGTGKTTTISQAPGRLFIPMEVGGSNIPKSTPLLRRWEDVVGLTDECIADAQAGRFAYKSMSWDSATAAERLLHDFTVRNDPDVLAGKKIAGKLSMESSHGGYGKAYIYANDRWAEWLAKLDLLCEYGGVNQFFSCHVFSNKVIDPTVGEYDAWDILLHSPKNAKTQGKREHFSQWLDMIGFMHSPLLVSKGEKFSQAMDAGQGRVMLVDRTPSAVAKNRYDLVQPISIPRDNGWNAVAGAIWESKKGTIDLWNRDAV